MKLSKFRRLVSLMCVVSMMCVIVAPAAAAANYDDQISPHFISCPDCGGDMDRIWMRDHYSNKYTLGRCNEGIHYPAWGDGYVWKCNRCSTTVEGTSPQGHFCTGKGGHYCFGGCSC